MIFWIVVAVCVLAIILHIFNEVFCWYEDIVELLTMLIAGVSGVITVILVIFIVLAHADSSSYLASKQETYNSLVYQYENEIFENDNDIIGKKELYNQIEDYNQDLAYGKKAQRDFWIGIFTPNIYDDLKFIEYKEIANVEN